MMSNTRSDSLFSSTWLKASCMLGLITRPCQHPPLVSALCGLQANCIMENLVASRPHLHSAAGQSGSSGCARVPAPRRTPSQQHLKKNPVATAFQMTLNTSNNVVEIQSLPDVNISSRLSIVNMPQNRLFAVCDLGWWSHHALVGRCICKMPSSGLDLCS